MAKQPSFKAKRRSFVLSHQFFDFCAGLAFFIGPPLELGLKSTLPVVFQGWAAVVCGALACVMLLLKNLLDHKTHVEHTSPRHLDSFTRSLHPILMSVGPSSAEPKLRICVYVPDGDNLLHVTDSVGFNAEDLGPIQRSVGVVGVAARSRLLSLAKLPKKGTHLPTVADFFVEHLGYDRVDAMRADQSRRSWVAVPVLNDDTLEAVLYCDACDRDFFGDQRSNRRKILEAAVIGVVTFIRSR